MLASAPAPVCHIHNESVALCLPAGELREDTAAVCGLLACFGTLRWFRNRGQP